MKPNLFIVDYPPGPPPSEAQLTMLAELKTLASAYDIKVIIPSADDIKARAIAQVEEELLTTGIPSLDALMIANGGLSKGQLTVFCAKPRNTRRIRIANTESVSFNVPVTTGTPSETNMTKATIGSVEFEGEIPEALAKETMNILRIHQVNGDLGWVKDMIIDLEAQAKRTPPLGAGQAFSKPPA